MIVWYLLLGAPVAVVVAVGGQAVVAKESYDEFERAVGAMLLVLVVIVSFFAWPFALASIGMYRLIQAGDE